MTGASAGIGTCLARELAERDHTLVIVARRQERLDELAGELRASHGVRVEPLACDLGDAQARAGLPERIADLGLEVDVLVNNAGFATGGAFHESDAEQELQQVRVLVEAVVGLTASFLAAMVQRGSGAILNVASTAGMQPLPYSAGYSAAKAHVLTFSEALHHEVGTHGVTVTALCPGPVETDFWELAGDQPIESAIPRLAWISAENAARSGIRGVEARRRVVVPGRPLRNAMRASQYLPHAIKLPVTERLMRPK